MRIVTPLCSADTSHNAFAAFLASAAFGMFWGTWGAALPALRANAELGEAALGTALLFVGLGALPAMLLTGRAIDRFGARFGGVLLVALALAGVLTASVARDLPTLAVAMAIVGATSGAADVGVNALAGLAEQRSGRRTITMSHAVFSSFVVVGSVGAGLLQVAGADVVTVFVAAGALIAIAGMAVFVSGDRAYVATMKPAPRRKRDGLRLALPFVVIGLVGALGFAAENAHQSWSAIFLADELATGPGLAAIAPATFAAFAALTRFGAGVFTGVPSTALLVGGPVIALLGTLLVSIAHEASLALVGFALAAVGTSVLFPTLLSRATRDVPADFRGRATSAVATTAYLGFVLGPVYVGVIAGVTGLRGAMVGVAVLVAAFAVLAPAATRRHSRDAPAVVDA